MSTIYLNHPICRIFCVFSLLWGAFIAAPIAKASPVAAHSATTIDSQLQKIAKQLTADTPKILRGQFTQKKTITGFKKPLLSSGSFVVARDKGVIWNTQAPFASQLLIKPNQLINIAGDDKQTLDASKEPGLRAFNQLLIALLAGQVDVLQNQFEILQATQTGSQWMIHLRPKESGMARFIQEITMRGEQYVEQVVLVEGEGDSSEITFSAQHPSDLTSQEQDWL
ncbi:outer membrane lipoprotein carrier protein LolA [Lampropedia puyangensis]|uniref:Outer membrane lipoprotein carrier protein LolA n=1 Tax=Lampropedia puyangensis TaxID=1330072 RepID=A0A4S8F8K9_9BURK|nr:outer membrane lipoprotein carrier protein LolA [Lampropedia puyangensis]THU02584.1 outer membrane lipoprotein carrier protein LolA [Lampropedia puyangensis]